MKQIVYNANLFIWQHSRDLQKFSGIWKGFEGFGEDFRDLEKISGSWIGFDGYGDFLGDLEEVSRDLEKF